VARPFVPGAMSADLGTGALSRHIGRLVCRPFEAIAGPNFRVRRDPPGERVRTSNLRTRSPVHPNYAAVLGDYGVLLQKLQRYDEAERLHREAPAMLRSCCGEEHLLFARRLFDYVVVLRKLNRKEEARIPASGATPRRIDFTLTCPLLRPGQNTTFLLCRQ
jgi:hypothetical protein